MTLSDEEKSGKNRENRVNVHDSIETTVNSQSYQAHKQVKVNILKSRLRAAKLWVTISYSCIMDCLIMAYKC